MKATVLVAVCLGSLALVRVASAGPANATATANSEGELAQQLFDGAVKLMAQGEFERACPMFAESERLDHGGGTVLNLALCYEKQGRFATAAKTYRDALAVAQKDRRADRVAFAETHLVQATALAARVRVVFSSPATDARVFFDGVALEQDALQSPLVVDPGVHEISVERAGYAPFADRFTVAAEGQHHVLVPWRAPSPVRTLPIGSAALTSASVEDGAPAPPSAQRVDSDKGALSSGRVHGHKIVGALCLAGAGVAAGSAGLFGMMAAVDGSSASWSSAAKSRGETFETVALVSATTAGALLVGGLLLVLYDVDAPKKVAKGLRWEF